MQFVILLFIAIGLSFDTFAASICIGLTLRRIRLLQILKIALLLAAFQAFMPAVGWVLGSQVKDLISHIDHWFAFGLLSLIGLKMVWESLQYDDDCTITDPSKPAVLIGIAVATSIDAFVAGVSFAFIEVNILLYVLTIGIVTCITAIAGMLSGKRAKKQFGKKITVVGGIILIVIGIKILIEHLNCSPVF